MGTPTTIRRTPIRDLTSHAAPFVTVRALANYWGVDPSTIYRAIRKGALRACRLGSGTVRIRTSDAVTFGRPPS